MASYSVCYIPGVRVVLQFTPVQWSWWCVCVVEVNLLIKCLEFLIQEYNFLLTIVILILGSIMLWLLVARSSYIMGIRMIGSENHCNGKTNDHHDLPTPPLKHDARGVVWKLISCSQPTATYTSIALHTPEGGIKEDAKMPRWKVRRQRGATRIKQLPKIHLIYWEPKITHCSSVYILQYM